MDEICTDLADEQDALDRLVGTLPPADWDLPTPAEGWAVRDQISHLGFYDRNAVEAATDPAAFAASTAELLQARVDLSVQPARTMDASALLSWWRAGRVALLGVLRGLDPKQRVPWYGRAMGALSFATARLMETWAHGEDVADALGVERVPTDRLRHVAHLGVQTRAFTFANRGLPVPEEPVYVGLGLPSGAPWSAGDPSASNRVTGSALDFCLVVTQRRHPSDTALVVEGPVAEHWLGIAQAFAGPPGGGRPPASSRPE